MVARIQTDRNLTELQRLHETLGSFVVCDEHRALAERAETLRNVVGGYLIPRLADPSVPMTVVFAGPTGSGKSTLVNSLTRLDISEAGVLRPTTTRPMVLCHPDRVDGYADLDGIECDVVSGDAPALATMTLVDTPDIDSTARRHRVMAERMIDGADVVVFVTSALRYADDVPWQVLRRAVARGAEVIHVLNRVGSTNAGSLLDFRSRLTGESMDDEVVVVSEYHLGSSRTMLPSVAIKGLAQRLALVASARDESTAEIRKRVSVVTWGQLTELATEAEQVATDHDTADELLVERLQKMAGDVAMPEVMSGITGTLAAGSTDADVRSWMREARASDETQQQIARKVIARMRAEIEARVRSTALAESAHRTFEIGHVLDGIEDVVEIAVSGWAHFVQRMTESLRARDRWPAQVSLMAETLGVDTSAVVDRVFAEESDDMRGRARRELEGRVEVIYSHLAERIVESSGPRLTIDHVVELRASIPRSALSADLDA